MPFVAPPTFVNGNVLSAAQLNVLSADISYLYGLSSGVNTASAGRSLLVQGTPQGWIFRHRANFMNLFLAWNVDLTYVNHLALTITADAVTLLNADPWKDSGDASGAGWFAFDVSALTLGQWYTLTLTCTSHTAGHVLVAGDRGGTALSSSAVLESGTDFSV